MSPSKALKSVPEARPRSARVSWAVTLTVVVLVSVATFWPVRNSTFLQDDHPIVQINPVVRQGGLRAIFGTDWWGGVGGSDASLYRPVTVLSFALQRSDGQVPPRPAHWANVVLHAVASLLLALYARRIGAGNVASSIAGAAFLVHPVHVSVVAGLVGRAEILSLLFGVAALLTQGASAAWPGSREPKRLLKAFAPWWTGVFLFLALGSKESAVAFPVLLLLQEWVIRPPRPREGWDAWRSRILALVPSGLAVLAYLALRGAVVGSPWSTQRVRLSENPLVALDGWDRVFTTLAVAGRYARLLLFPSTLSPDYSGNVVATESSLWAPYPMAGAILLAGLVVAAALGWRAGRRRTAGAPPDGATAAILGSALFLLPYLVVGQILVLVGVVLAERLIYVPSAGFCVLAALLAGVAWERWRGAVRVTVAIVLASILLAAAVKTHRETRHWKNSETLFEAAVEAAPQSPRAQFTLGKIRLDQGRVEEALSRFEEAIRLWPQFSSAWYEKGMILAQRGRLEEAELALAQAAGINPWNVSAHVNYGIVLHRTGKIGAAEEQLRSTLERHPAAATAAAELGHVLYETGRSAEAAAWYGRAVELGREDLEPRRRACEEEARRAGIPVPVLPRTP